MQSISRQISRGNDADIMHALPIHTDSEQFSIIKTSNSKPLSLAKKKVNCPFPTPIKHKILIRRALLTYKLVCVLEYKARRL